MSDTFCFAATAAFPFPASAERLICPSAAQYLPVQASLPDTRRLSLPEDSMFIQYDRTFASPSLEATMNHGQFGCANLTPDCHAVCMQRNSRRDKRATVAPAPARAKGFSAYLSGRLQRT
ncbi:MAG: hypothetical protein Q8S22_04510 [Eubacteriales bacterium]|jgi:hypothetical protein|nr:hypothetical protein [Eubacteriales bacterium]